MKDRFVWIVLVLQVFIFVSEAQVAANVKLKVYIEGEVIDFDYLRSNISFVDFLNDSYSSDVHIVVSQKSTGSGGKHYYISFTSVTIKSINNLMLSCITSSHDTQDDVRLKFSNTIITGLLVFANEKQLQYQVNVIDSLSDTFILSSLTDTTDPWNNWVFNIGINGGIDAEEQKQNYEYESSLEVNRITEYLRIRNEYSFSREESYISKYQDSTRVVLYALNQKQGFKSRIAQSLTSHWSAGIFLQGYQTSYRNTKFNASVRPAIEYNFYPWQQIHQRIFTAAYYVGPSFYKYYETTIADKTSELLWIQSLKIDLEKIETWGEIEIWLEAEHFFPGRKHFAFEIGTELSIKLAKGLFLDFSFEMEKIKNQFYLPASELSDEELLLDIRKLPTSFEFSGDIGIRFQFGSVYNNVVNQRL